MNDFREGKSKVLIATDVIERGIDVNAVKMVVNFDIKMGFDNKPDKVHLETHMLSILLCSCIFDVYTNDVMSYHLQVCYAHRIGRCGRFGTKGVGISLVTSDEEVKAVQEICRVYAVPLNEIPLNEDDMDRIISKALGGDSSVTPTPLSAAAPTPAADTGGW